MIQLNLDFKNNYQCHIVLELIANEMNRLFFPGTTDQGGLDGITIKVSPLHGDPWTGTFAFSSIATHKGATGVFSMPNPDYICVIAKGNGFLVPVYDPKKYEIIQAVPIIDGRSILDKKMLIFSTFTDIIAYSVQGLLWRTERLAWNDMKIIKVTNDFLVGEFWDLASDRNQTFIVDVLTGKSRKIDESFDIKT
jgi:hypothetical protein